MGGSTSAGITSGLSRQGYHEGGSDRPRTTPEKILQGYGPAPRGYNVYDFLTEWGLNMASSPPMGNVIQTAAGTAREPYSKMVEGKGKAGQLEYAMRAQAHDAARTQNLQLYLEGEKRKSAERIAGMKTEGPPVDYYTRFNTNFDNLKNINDDIFPNETHKDGMAHWKTLKEFNTDIVLGPVIEKTLENNTTQWKMKEDQDILKKYVGERVWDPTEGDAGAFKIVIEEDGIYKWSEPYYSNIGSGKDKYQDLTLIKLDNIIKDRVENKELINGDDPPPPDIVEKIEMIKEGDRTAVTETLKILNDATFEELEKLASDRGYLLIPPYPVGHGKGHVKKKRLYTEQAKEDMGGTFRGKAISEYELIDMIKKEALHKQFGSGRRRKQRG